jgi:putative flippase GtrA
MSAETASSEVASPRKGLVGQLFWFGLSGAVGAVVDFSSLHLFIAVGIEEDVCRGLSFLLGSTTAYLLNRRWTFHSRRNVQEVRRVAIIYSLTFVLIEVINGIAIRTLPASPWQITIAWVLSQGIGTTFNFVAQRILVFR